MYSCLFFRYIVFGNIYFVINDKDGLPEWVYIFIYILSFIPFLSNPLIFVASNPAYRKAYVKILNCKETFSSSFMLSVHSGQYKTQEINIRRNASINLPLLRREKSQRITQRRTLSMKFSSIKRSKSDPLPQMKGSTKQITYTYCKNCFISKSFYMVAVFSLQVPNRDINL